MLAVGRINVCLFTNKLPIELYQRKAIVQAELAAVAAGDCSLYELVEKAGTAAFELLKFANKLQSNVLILAGNGNNGADAFVIARKLIENNINCILLERRSSHQTDEIIEAQQGFLDAGGKINELTLHSMDEALSVSETIVDGLLGTGINGKLRQDLCDFIEKINTSKQDKKSNDYKKWILSLDLPSGIQADTGVVDPIAINADMTLCFGGLKQGLFTGSAKNYTGDIYFADLGLSSFLHSANAFRYDEETVPYFLPKRAKNSNKGNFGKLLAIGGDLGMAGAIRLSSEASLRSGAGLVTVVSHSINQSIINNNRPELMFCAFDEYQSHTSSDWLKLKDKIDWCSNIVLGPGLGIQEWGQALFAFLLTFNKPMLLDADALNLLAKITGKKSNWILTPHPGEAARLLGTSIAEIEKDRFAAIKKLHHQYGGVILLKGAGTLVFDGKKLIVCPVGNPGLASGGCGDVLSGVIGALISQGLDLMAATVLGVVVHGKSADLAVRRDGEIGMLASDLLSYIRQLLNKH